MPWSPPDLRVNGAWWIFLLLEVPIHNPFQKVDVEFKNSVPKKQIYNILAKSDSLFFSLKNANVFKYGISSNKLFDYLASAKPVIFSTDAINNPIKEANAGFTVSPDSPEEIANAIIKLYNMPKEKRLEMGLNGRKYVEKHYSIPILVDKLEDLLYKVINMY